MQFVAHNVHLGQGLASLEYGSVKGVVVFEIIIKKFRLNNDMQGFVRLDLGLSFYIFYTRIGIRQLI